MIYDNQALRLHNALSKLRTFPDVTRLSDSFSSTLNLEKNNLPKIYSGIGQIYEYLDQIEECAKAYPSITKQFSMWSPKIIQAFLSLNINSYTSVFTQNYNKDTLDLIEMTHLSLIERFEHVKLLESKKIEQLILDLEELKNNFDSEDISDSVKSYILNQLNTLIVNLRQYEILGSSNIQTTIESSIGHLIISKEYANIIKNNPLGKSLLEKLVGIGAALQIMESGTQILGRVLI